MPADLEERIRRSGYYPDLVADALDVSLGGEEVLAHLVHGETTFDSDSVRRHLSVLVLTASRLIFVHADDHTGADFLGDEHGAHAHAIVSSEAVPLSRLGPVMVTHVVPEPDHYQAGDLGRDLTLTLSWGAVSRIELEPAICPDPQCEADHGLAGVVSGDDLSLRISSQADGPDALQAAQDFARALSTAMAHHPR